MSEAQSARLLFVVNPVSGTTDSVALRTLIEARCAASERDYEIYETNAEDNVTEVVRERVAQGFEVFVAAGGDGTVSAVANGLIGTTARLAIIPAGTSNVLARELAIPLDHGGAIDLALAGEVVRILDAMEYQGQHFLLQIGIGITSLMHRDTPREAKRRFGQLAYIVTATRWLFGFQPRSFNIVIDGVRRRISASQIMIANGGMLGNQFFRMAESIDPTDGVIDVCALHASTFGDYVRYGVAMLRRRQRDLGRFKRFRAREHISLTTKRSLPVQADGELIGKTPIQVRVVPAAVRVIVGGPLPS